MIREEVFDQYEDYIRARNCIEKSELEDFDPIHDVYSEASDKEGYKYEIASRAQYLNTKFWGQRRNVAHSSREILEFARAILALDENLMDFRSRGKFEGEIGAALESNGDELARIIRNLYCGDDDKKTFEDLQRYANSFDVLTYLFFTKDPNRFLPLRPSVFDKAFLELGIECVSLVGPTWEKYDAFLEIMREIREELIDRYPTSGISLLDAHNFVWIVTQYRITDKIAKPTGYKVKEQPLEKMPAKRNGQQTYRKNIFEMWNQRCAVTGCTNKALLVASHIQPYAECNENEAYDPDNGILLAKNYDSLFDAGLITFHPETGEMQISKKLGREDLEAMGIVAHKKINFSEGQKKYLAYHYKYVFKDGQEGRACTLRTAA